MGYMSDKQLRADYLFILRKTRERERQSNERTEQKNKMLTSVAVLIFVFLCYLVAYYR
jgi:hypothetical protein